MATNVRLNRNKIIALTEEDNLFVQFSSYNHSLQFVIKGYSASKDILLKLDVITSMMHAMIRCKN